MFYIIFLYICQKGIFWRVNHCEIQRDIYLWLDGPPQAPIFLRLEGYSGGAKPPRSFWRVRPNPPPPPCFSEFSWEGGVFQVLSPDKSFVSPSDEHLFLKYFYRTQLKKFYKFHDSWKSFGTNPNKKCLQNIFLHFVCFWNLRARFCAFFYCFSSNVM